MIKIEETRYSAYFYSDDISIANLYVDSPNQWIFLEMADSKGYWTIVKTWTYQYLGIGMLGIRAEDALSKLTKDVMAVLDEY